MSAQTLRDYWGNIAVKASDLQVAVSRVPASGVFHRDLSEDLEWIDKSLQGVIAVAWNEVMEGEGEGEASLPDIAASGVDYEAIIERVEKIQRIRDAEKPTIRKAILGTFLAAGFVVAASSSIGAEGAEPAPDTPAQVTTIHQPG